jgi:Tol biopolymer transport system component
VKARWAAAPVIALVLAAGASGDPMKLQGRIAFSAGPLEPGRSNVYVYDLSTGKTTRVTRGRGIEFDPTLSPAGTRVAWRSTRNGNEEIRVANVDGSRVRNLTRHPAGDYAPAWSPDGRKLAFASTRWRGSHVWIMNADGSNPHVLTRAFTGEYPAWSPDGRQIVFATNQPPRQDGFDLVVVDADGRNAHRISNNDLYEMGPAWSRAGDWIAFHAGNGGFHDLYLVRPDGSERRLVVSCAEMPSWSPDGRYIVYAAPSGLAIIDADGRDVGRVLTDVGGGNFPSWARSGR